MYYFDKMPGELYRCHLIGMEFKLNPHDIYENWSMEEIAQTYSFIRYQASKIKKR